MVTDDTIRCTKCGRQVEDTRTDSITCRFCGNVFRRIDVIKQEEEELKAKMLVELTYSLSVLKTSKMISIGLGILLSLLSLVFLFAKEVTPIPIILIILFLAAGIVWLVMGGIFSKKYADNHSKQFDLTEGRKLLQ